MLDKEYVELAKEGRRYFAEGRYELAMKAFDKILQAYPYDTDASEYYAKAEQMLVRKEYI